MPKDDGLVADVQSRAHGALYKWNQPFNDQSAAHYSEASRRYRVESRARRPLSADIHDVGCYHERQLDRAGQTLKKLAAPAPDAVAWLSRLRWAGAGN